jgi:hypothetical protein
MVHEQMARVVNRGIRRVILVGTNTGTCRVTLSKVGSLTYRTFAPAFTGAFDRDLEKPGHISFLKLLGFSRLNQMGRYI